MTPREKAIMFIAIHRTVHNEDTDMVELRDSMKEFLNAVHGNKLDVEQVLQDVDAYDPELHNEVTKWIKWCREDLKV